MDRGQYLGKAHNVALLNTDCVSTIYIGCLAERRTEHVCQVNQKPFFLLSDHSKIVPTLVFMVLNDDCTHLQYHVVNESTKLTLLLSDHSTSSNTVFNNRKNDGLHLLHVMFILSFFIHV